MENNRDTSAKRWMGDRLSMLLPDGDWRPDLTRGLGLLRDRRGRKHVHHARLLWIALTTLAIGVVLIAFPTTRILAGRYVSACVNLLGRFSGDTPNLAYTEGAHRKPAPEVTLKDRTGRSVRLSDLRGNVVLLTFWKADCDICDAEMPWFIEFQQTYRDHNFIFLNHQVAAGSEDILQLFGGPQSIPTTFLIDKLGRIAVTHVGLCSKGEYQTAIEALLNEPNKGVNLSENQRN